MKRSLLQLSAVLAMVGLVTACQTLPTGTQAGNVYEILITEAGPEPRDLTVETGDEIRFRNERRYPSYVSFFQDYRDELSCRRGFEFIWGKEEGAKIDPDDSASLCFRRSGNVGYKVQFEKTVVGGVIGSPGEIYVPPGYSGAIIVQ